MLYFSNYSSTRIVIGTYFHVREVRIDLGITIWIGQMEVPIFNHFTSQTPLAAGSNWSPQMCKLHVCKVYEEERGVRRQPKVEKSAKKLLTIC